MVRPASSAGLELCGVGSLDLPLVIDNPPVPDGNQIDIESDDPHLVTLGKVDPTPEALKGFVVATAPTDAPRVVTLTAKYKGVTLNSFQVELLPESALHIDAPSRVPADARMVTATVTFSHPRFAHDFDVSVWSASEEATVKAVSPVANGKSVDVSIAHLSQANVAQIAALYQNCSVRKKLDIEAVAPPHCQAPLQPCDCGNGQADCVASTHQCLSFCSNQ